MKYHIPLTGVMFTSTAALKQHLMPTLIRRQPTQAELATIGVYIVETAEKPTVTSAQVAELNAMPDHVSGVSTLNWTTRNKTPEEVDADLQAERDSMEVQRGYFAIAAMQLSHITATEAAAWGAGNSLPANVEAAITAAFSDQTGLIVLDQTGLDSALVIALTRPTIRRVSSLVEVVRAGLAITAVALDAIFELAETLQGQG